MRADEKYNCFGCLDMTVYLALRNIEQKENLERQTRQGKLNNIVKQGKNNIVVSKEG